MRVQNQNPLLSVSRHFELVFASLFVVVLCGFVHALVYPQQAKYGKHHCQEHQRRNKSKPNPKHRLLATNIDEDGTENILESPSFPQSDFGNLDNSPLPIESSILHPSQPSSSLEEILLTEHNALESFLAESGERQTSGDSSSVDEYTSSSTNNKREQSIPYFLTPVPYFLQHDTKTTTSNSQDPKDVSNLKPSLLESQEIDKENDVYPEAASIDRAIYQFNNYLVHGLYVIIMVLYPNDRKRQQLEATNTRMMINPLFGDEYNPTAKTETTLGFEKFYVFETVARIPYFAYLSVLHLRETLGAATKPIHDNSRRNSNRNNEKRISTMRTHYAQADNELHHRLIMEALGGNDRAFDRILAHTLAFFYYWFVVVVFLWKEQAAYHLNEIVEDHAYRIYDEVRAPTKVDWHRVRNTFKGNFDNLSIAAMYNLCFMADISHSTYFHLFHSFTTNYLISSS